MNKPKSYGYTLIYFRGRGYTMSSFESYVQDYIVKSNLSTQLTEIPKVDLEDFLLENHILEQSAMLKLKQQYYCVQPYISTNINPIVLSNEAKILCVNSLILPINMTEDTLEIVMADPFMLHEVELLRLITARKVICKVGLKCWIRANLNAIILEEQYNNEEFSEKEGLTLEESEGHMKATIRSIIVRAIYAQASDIHIEPRSSKVVIRFRVDGKLKIISELPNCLELINCVKIFAKMDITERKIPQDGYFAFKNEEKKYDLRVSTMPNVHGEKIVIRLRSSEDTKISLEELGMAKEHFRLIQYLLNLKEGMVIVTGPTGSGKSTTLVSVLNVLKNSDVNIVTIEDPVETLVDGITQVAVNEKQGLDFENSLRAALRQDIDILMIGEMRDKVTADIATRAALTGHSIWTTLHTENSVGALFRLSDMGVDKVMIKETVKGVISQRLLRKLCISCNGAGCDKCAGAGYKGRIGIFEILIPHIHLKGASYDNMHKVATDNGLITLKQQAQKLVSSGITSYEEVYRVLGNLEHISEKVDI